MPNPEPQNELLNSENLAIAASLLLPAVATEGITLWSSVDLALTFTTRGTWKIGKSAIKEALSTVGERVFNPARQSFIPGIGSGARLYYQIGAGNFSKNPRETLQMQLTSKKVEPFWSIEDKSLLVKISNLKLAEMKVLLTMKHAGKTSKEIAEACEVQMNAKITKAFIDPETSKLSEDGQKAVTLIERYLDTPLSNVSEKQPLTAIYQQIKPVTALNTIKQDKAIVDLINKGTTSFEEIFKKISLATTNKNELLTDRLLFLEEQKIISRQTREVNGAEDATQLVAKSVYATDKLEEALQTRKNFLSLSTGARKAFTCALLANQSIGNVLKDYPIKIEGSDLVKLSSLVKSGQPDFQAINDGRKIADYILSLGIRETREKVLSDQQSKSLGNFVGQELRHINSRAKFELKILKEVQSTPQPLETLLEKHGNRNYPERYTKIINQMAADGIISIT